MKTERHSYGNGYTGFLNLNSLHNWINNTKTELKALLQHPLDFFNALYFKYLFRNILDKSEEMGLT